MLVLVAMSLNALVFSQSVETDPHANEPCGFATVLSQLEKQYPGFKASFDQQTQLALQLPAMKAGAQGIDRRKKIVRAI